MSAMRILMAAPKYPFPVVGGLERQAHELAKALVRRGHVVHALSSRFDAAQSDVETIEGVRVHRVKWREFKPIRFLLFPFGLARIMVKLRRDVDLVHVHNISWFGGFIMLFAKILGLPVMNKLLSVGDFGIPGVRHRAFGFLLVVLLKRCDAIVAMAPESMAEIDGIGYPRKQVLKVTNGIPLVPAGGAPVARSLPGVVTAIFVGRLSAEKGLPDLLHAWALVKERATRPVRLLLIGEGPQAEELRAMALGLGLGDAVEFAGYCEDVPTELAKADLFVLPSYAEGNSNAILEAMRAGLPVVATRVGGASIQVGCEGGRFLVPSGDRQALAGALTELIEDKELRLRLGAAMRNRIENVFDIDRVAAVYEQTYELILSRRRDLVGQINPDLFLEAKTEDLQCAG